MPVPVSTKLSTPRTMALRMNEKVSCDQLRISLAESGVAKLDVLITLKLNFRY